MRERRKISIITRNIQYLEKSVLVLDAKHINLNLNALEKNLQSVFFRH